MAEIDHWRVLDSGRNLPPHFCLHHAHRPQMCQVLWRTRPGYPVSGSHFLLSGAERIFKRGEAIAQQYTGGAKRKRNGRIGVIDKIQDILPFKKPAV